MSNAEEIEKEFIEGIGKLKKGSWGNDNSEIDEALNAGYKQGISDVQIMLRGEFVDDLTFTTAKEFAEAHTNQTLQELKAKANNLHTYDLKELFPDDPTAEYVNKSDVLQLIDQCHE